MAQLNQRQKSNTYTVTLDLRKPLGLRFASHSTSTSTGGVYVKEVSKGSQGHGRIQCGDLLVTVGLNDVHTASLSDIVEMFRTFRAEDRTPYLDLQLVAIPRQQPSKHQNHFNWPTIPTDYDKDSNRSTLRYKSMPQQRLTWSNQITSVDHDELSASSYQQSDALNSSTILVLRTTQTQLHILEHRASAAVDQWARILDLYSSTPQTVLRDQMKTSQSYSTALSHSAGLSHSTGLSLSGVASGLSEQQRAHAARCRGRAQSTLQRIQDEINMVDRDMQQANSMNLSSRTLSAHELRDSRMLQTSSRWRASTVDRLANEVVDAQQEIQRFVQSLDPVLSALIDIPMGTNLNGTFGITERIHYPTVKQDNEFNVQQPARTNPRAYSYTSDESASVPEEGTRPRSRVKSHHRDHSKSTRNHGKHAHTHSRKQHKQERKKHSHHRQSRDHEQHGKKVKRHTNKVKRHKKYALEPSEEYALESSLGPLELIRTKRASLDQFTHHDRKRSIHSKYTRHGRTRDDASHVLNKETKHKLSGSNLDKKHISSYHDTMTSFSSDSYSGSNSDFGSSSDSNSDSDSNNSLSSMDSHSSSLNTTTTSSHDKTFKKNGHSKGHRSVHDTKQNPKHLAAPSLVPPQLSPSKLVDRFGRTLLRPAEALQGKDKYRLEKPRRAPTPGCTLGAETSDITAHFKKFRPIYEPSQNKRNDTNKEVIVAVNELKHPNFSDLRNHRHSNLSDSTPHHPMSIASAGVESAQRAAYQAARAAGYILESDRNLIVSQPGIGKNQTQKDDEPTHQAATATTSVYPNKDTQYKPAPNVNNYTVHHTTTDCEENQFNHIADKIWLETEQNHPERLYQQPNDTQFASNQQTMTLPVTIPLGDHMKSNPSCIPPSSTSRHESKQQSFVETNVSSYIPAHTIKASPKLHFSNQLNPSYKSENIHMSDKTFEDRQSVENGQKERSLNRGDTVSKSMESNTISPLNSFNSFTERATRKYTANPSIQQQSTQTKPSEYGQQQSLYTAASSIPYSNRSEMNQKSSDEINTSQQNSNIDESPPISPSLQVAVNRLSLHDLAASPALEVRQIAEDLRKRISESLRTKHESFSVSMNEIVPDSSQSKATLFSSSVYDNHHHPRVSAYFSTNSSR